MKNSKLKNFFIVLFLGGLWGFLETTLGTLLHLDVFDSIMFTSTAVLLPLAYLIMGAAYKETGSAKSVLFVGLLAAACKAICFTFMPVAKFNKVINPMVAIILESCVTACAFAIAKPKKIISLETFVSFIAVSFVTRIAYVGYSIATAVPFKSAYINEGTLVWSKIIEYVFTTNAISFVYMAGFMGLGVAHNKLVEATKAEKTIGKLKYLVYSPVFASIMFVLAVVTTYLHK